MGQEASEGAAVRALAAGKKLIRPHRKAEMRVEHFKWMREHSSKYNLSSSSMRPIPPESLRGEPVDLRMQLAEVYETGPEGVVLSHGTQEANFLAVASLRERVTRAQVILPEYEPIRLLPGLLGLKLEFIPSPWDVGSESLLVFSCPNNPLGDCIGVEGLQELSSELVRKRSYAVVDSIFADFLGVEMFPLENVIMTSSTSKFYTIKGVKVGWAVASRDLAEHMRGIGDLVSPGPFDLEERYGSLVISMRNALFHSNAAELSTKEDILGSLSGYSVVHMRGMPIAFLDLPHGPDSLGLAELFLRSGILTVPGKLFGADRGVRIGLGVPSREEFKEAMDIAQELAHLSPSSQSETPPAGA